MDGSPRRSRGCQLIILFSAEVIMNGRGTFSRLAGTLGLLGMLLGTLPAAAQQSGTSSRGQATQSTSSAPSLPDSPSAVRLNANDERTTANNSIALLQQPQGEPEGATQPESASQQKPVGTAASEAPNVSAIAASQPAGAAIAPAKQHRVRTIILRTGAIIGAGVAIGAVVALTAATPPKPPGAH
jgi:hypothetical protein